MSHTPQVRHIVGAVLAGLVLEGWLSTRELCPLRAASTEGFDSYSLAIRAYSYLLHERPRYPTPPILVEEDSEGSLLPEEEESDEESAVVVSDEDDTWERAFGFLAE